MKKLILGVLAIVSLAACEQAQSPVVGSWSYVASYGTVTYTFETDKSCSLTVPDLAAGGTKTFRGTYTTTNVGPSSPEQLLVDVAWEEAAESSAFVPALLTPLTWDATKRGFSINLNKQP